MRYRFVDCRYDLAEPGRAERAYLAGHIPGAAFLDLDRDLADLTDAPARGRHPLPGAAAFAASASAAGIGGGVFVVAYDDGVQGGAARLWWLLRHFGHDDVAVLGGGLDAWRGPLRRGRGEIAHETFALGPRRGDTIEADELHARLGEPGLVVVDARSPSRFAGEPDPLGLDPVGGRIPGAINLPYTGTGPVPDGVLAADEIVVYCGSGVTACVPLLALHEAGRDDARLYAGSWSEWSRRGLPNGADEAPQSR